MLPNVLPRSAADHVPVLAEEVRELLAVRPGETVVDATFGAGGHARLLAEDLARRRASSSRSTATRPRSRTSTASRPAPASTSGSCAATSRRAGASSPRTTCRPTRSCSTSASPRCRSTGPSAASRTRPTRRSTCAWTPPPSSTAAEIVNTWDERELATVFRRYGEERYARQIARAIVRRRAERPFERTGELVETIKSAIPTPARFGEGHPAKRVFQALRIAVNDELGALEAALPPALEMLRPGGRLAVISFHSLEDRIVKRFFAASAQGLHLPARVPRLRLREGAGAPPPHAKPVRPVVARDRRQPARGIGAAARRGEGLTMTTVSRRRSVESRRARRGRRAPRRATASRGGVLWIVVARRAARRRRRRQRARAPAQRPARPARERDGRSSRPTRGAARAALQRRVEPARRAGGARELGLQPRRPAAHRVHPSCSRR